MGFKLVSDFLPTGDQPEAIHKLTEGIEAGVYAQTLLGATGSGKTFTIANVIKNTGKKTLVLAPNKTLAGQLYGELKRFFPENHVEYFISYYDYYQPEAYVPGKDLYIEKDASINDDIDRMRHGATAGLSENEDVIVVASVSCIYGIGDPEDYKEHKLVLKKGTTVNRREMFEKLVAMLFRRSDSDPERGTFRVRGDVVEIIPATKKEEGIRIEFFDDEIEKIKIFDTVSGKTIDLKDSVTIYPATLFTAGSEKMKEAIRRIKAELTERIAYFEERKMLLEADRIKKRTLYDLEMLSEIGYCSGIENYSRHLSLREEGAEPYTLIDFFGDDFLLVVDESHVTIPQVRAMYNGDRSRKVTLVENGFRLPSALDNRPLTFSEFERKIKQVIFVSATPGPYEKALGEITEQIIRPTGLLDPEIEVRPSRGQIDDLIAEIKKRKETGERTLVMTLTIRMSEDLTAYLKDLGIKTAYLHSEVKSLERLEIIRALRKGTYDVLVGINLLREGLDLPEVSLMAILDADKEGFLRSDTALIQIIGRTARNAHGKVIMYADCHTKSMDYAIAETMRRRRIQSEYNIKHRITPRTVYKEIGEPIVIAEEEKKEKIVVDYNEISEMSKTERRKIIIDLEKKMKEAARKLDFEQAMVLRDVIIEIKAAYGGER